VDANETVLLQSTYLLLRPPPIPSALEYCSSRWAYLQLFN